MSKKVFSLDFEGKKLSVETGEIAKQADGAVLVRLNDTVVLSTVCASDEPKDGDFFPLTVGYEEKQYAVGKIPGSFLRREGRPGEHATLTARLIDRPIRPMFADGFRNEVQIVNTVMSVDPDATPEMAAMFGSSLALGISDIPFDGPIAGVYVGRVDGKFVINPTAEEKAKSDLNLALAGTEDAINMVEAGAQELSEEEMLDALMFGHEAIKKLCAFEKEIIAEIGKPKREVSLYTVSEEIQNDVTSRAKDRLIKAVSIVDKLERYEAIDKINNEIRASYEEKEYKNEKEKNQTMMQVNDIL
jgi:polyribonucleotide nucleotidyltransferase